jgi:glycosyltransferase involved in cell wall biosynthesis
MMRVSVLVPVYNAERYLSECLESILSQDFSDFEVIISDDSSTDSSPRIIQSFAARDSRIRWSKNPRNLGEAGNSNVCLKEARGKYIKFVHADDKLLSPAAFGKMVRAMEDHPSASLVGCRQHLTPTDVDFRYEPQNLSQSVNCFNGREMIVTCLEKDANLIGNPSHTLFRRSQTQRGFDERYNRMVDYEMWFHLLEQGDYVHLPEALATWRLHPKQRCVLAWGTEPLEGLWLVESYYEKEWLRAAATRKMLYVQSRSLKRKYGAQAADVVRSMRTSLPPAEFLAYWFERKRAKIARWAGKTVNRFRHEPPPVT